MPGEFKDDGQADTTNKLSNALMVANGDPKVAQVFVDKSKNNLKDKIKKLISKWWHNPKARNSTLAGFGVALIGLLIFPTTRYFIMNSLGVRSSALVTVLDNSTQLPLKNVEVKLANQSGVTDDDGKVKLEHLKLGRTDLVINKRAFAARTERVTIGWGSNRMGEFPLTAVGAQYSFVVKDWLSGKPIEKAEAQFGLASAFSDKDGKILLTIDTEDVEDDMAVLVGADNYREEQIKLSAETKDAIEVKAVPVRKVVFVSKRSGKYDLYTADADGKNEKKLLGGTGYERDDIALVPHPTDEVAALVSTRVNVRDSDGYLLSTLTLLDINEKTTFGLAQAERIQIIGWVGNRLLYVQVVAGSSAPNPKRLRLMSYDYKTTDKQELAAANSFNDVILAKGNVYYAPSNPYQSGTTLGLIKSSADGKNKQNIIGKEVWNIFRTSYDKLDLSIQRDWYEYVLGDSVANKLVGAPADTTSRIYADSPDGRHSVRVDKRDGRGVLLLYDTATKEEKALKTQSGLINPVRWLTNNTMIYRVNTDQETADYVINLEGGEARKVVDVTNIGGIDKWYYY